MQSNAKLTLGILGFALAGAAFACARRGVVHERLADGSYSLKCDEELWVCLSHVQDVCKGGPYEVLGGRDEPKTHGVDQYRVESHRSQAHIRCLRPGQAPTTTAFAKPVAAPTAVHVVPGKPAPPPPAPARACVPGSTQACIGAAACSGGQACLADGSGFGPCDCGSK